MKKPIVLTPEGEIHGIHEEGILAFKGIPCTAPPVGGLQWRPPMLFSGLEKSPINELGHSSLQEVEACLEPGGDPRPINEDCLYLNVWTPASGPGSKPVLPVMVWIHGGAFVLGAGGVPPYIGAPLASKNMVLVTVNYRLGPLGLFAHLAPEARTAGGGPTNFGLLDQIDALEWIQKNISRFGGNPEDVTIFGRSASARSVLAHCSTRRPAAIEPTDHRRC